MNNGALIKNKSNWQLVMTNLQKHKAFKTFGNCGVDSLALVGGGLDGEMQNANTYLPFTSYNEFLKFVGADFLIAQIFIIMTLFQPG